MVISKSHLFLGVAVIGLSAAITTPAAAQDSVGGREASAESSEGITEIVVTAQKRTESLQKVPLAISAIGSAELQSSEVRSIDSLQYSVPNLNIGQNAGSARIALRGVGLENTAAGAEGSIAVHVDGVFISSAAAALAGFYDLERIEVLRGPQGTLYGRNATGGAINIISKRPTKDFEGYIGATYGNYDRMLVEGAVSGPIVEGKLLARIAYQQEERDGFGRNVITGTQIDDASRQSLRGKLEFLPAEHVSILLSADYHHESDRNYAYHYGGAGGSTLPTGILLGGSVASNSRDIASDVDPSNERDFWGVSSEITLDLESITIKSLSAYRSTKYITSADIDNTSFQLAPFVKNEYSKQFSQEFNLSGSTGKLDWLIGAFYFRDRVEGAIAAPISTALFGAPSPHIMLQGYFGGGELSTNAYALFGQGTYILTDKLKITVGARYSNEKKAIDETFAFDVSRPFSSSNTPVGLKQVTDHTFHAFTPRIALDYSPVDQVLIYGAWSKGFKSGTYNLGAVQAVLNPEKVDAIEFGLKANTADNRLQANLAAFHYNYSDLQVGKVIGQVLGLENAASARIYGLEVELRAEPVAGLSLNFTGAWLHARFRDYISRDPARPGGDGQTLENGLPAYDLSGNALSKAPDFTLAGGAEYQFDIGSGTLTARGEVSWSDKVFFSPFNLAKVSQKANTLGNVFLTYRPSGDRWTLSAFMKNVGNRLVVSNALVGSGLVGFPVDTALNEPRMYGVSVRFTF